MLRGLQAVRTGTMKRVIGDKDSHPTCSGDGHWTITRRVALLGDIIHSHRARYTGDMYGHNGTEVTQGLAGLPPGDGASRQLGLGLLNAQLLVVDEAGLLEVQREPAPVVTLRVTAHGRVRELRDVKREYGVRCECRVRCYFTMLNQLVLNQ